MYSIKNYMGYCTPYQFELLVAAPKHIPLSSCGPLEEKVGHPWTRIRHYKTIIFILICHHSVHTSLSWSPGSPSDKLECNIILRFLSIRLRALLKAAFSKHSSIFTRKQINKVIIFVGIRIWIYRIENLVWSCDFKQQAAISVMDNIYWHSIVWWKAGSCHSKLRHWPP